VYVATNRFIQSATLTVQLWIK